MAPLQSSSWSHVAHRPAHSKSSPMQIGIAVVFTWTLLLNLGQLASTRAPGCLTQSRTSEALSGQGFTSRRLRGSKQPRSKQPAGAWAPRSRWWPGPRVMAAPEEGGKQRWCWRAAGGMMRFYKDAHHEPYGDYQDSLPKSCIAEDVVLGHVCKLVAHSANAPTCPLVRIGLQEGFIVPMSFSHLPVKQSNPGECFWTCSKIPLLRL